MYFPNCIFFKLYFSQLYFFKPYFSKLMYITSIASCDAKKLRKDASESSFVVTGCVSCTVLHQLYWVGWVALVLSSCISCYTSDPVQSEFCDLFCKSKVNWQSVEYIIYHGFPLRHQDGGEEGVQSAPQEYLIGYDKTNFHGDRSRNFRISHWSSCM